MLLNSAVDELIEKFKAVVEEGDILIDGGNEWFENTERRAKDLAEVGIRYLAVGVSGGEEGARKGPSMMPGGPKDAWDCIAPIFTKVAAQVDGNACTAYLGRGGSGNYVKMVHNGIEYGMMAAIAEGLGILEAADAGTEERQADAETAPLDDPWAYQYDFDIEAITELWRRGSVINSWLIDLTANALAEDPQLSHFAGRVSDSGMGRWTVNAAVDTGVPAHVITASLLERFASRDNFDYAGKAISAMRMQFGGHHEKKS